MKTTKVMLLMAALVGAAAISANAGVRLDFSVGIPVPVVVAPAPVCVAPAPIVETAPPCPGVDYVWSPGYYTPAHVWVGGCWNYRPARYYYGGHDNYRHDFDRHDGDRGHDRGWHR